MSRPRDATRRIIYGMPAGVARWRFWCGTDGGTERLIVATRGRIAGVYIAIRVFGSYRRFSWSLWR